MKPSKEQSERWRKDPNNWRWKFYYNPDDKRLIVREYWNDGWTFNLAHKYGLALTIVFLLILLYGVYELIAAIPAIIGIAQ
jgi:uncharacterized membrane protein